MKAGVGNQEYNSFFELLMKIQKREDLHSHHSSRKSITGIPRECLVVPVDEATTHSCLTYNLKKRERERENHFKSQLQV